LTRVLDTVEKQLKFKDENNLYWYDMILIQLPVNAIYSIWILNFESHEDCHLQQLFVHVDMTSFA
jgi:hypothetical protein